MALYDQFGREIQAGAIRRPVTEDIAVAQVRDRWSNYPSSGLTPERLAQIFRDADNGDVPRQAELFEEMEEKDAHLASQFQTRKLAVQGLEFDIQPGGEDAKDKKIAQYCREAIEALPDWDDHVLDLLDAIPKGYSMAEILWEMTGSQVRIRGLRWIHAKRITFWNSLTPRLLTEAEPGRGVDPQPWKFVYHRCRTRSGYDTRAGILRVCAWMYLFKNYAVKDWVSFAEVYGQPLRVGKFESGASPGDKDALLAAIRSIGTDAAGIISKNTEIEFIEAQRSGTLDVYDGLVEFCDAQMSKAILGQTLTSEAGGRKGQGSLALGRVHADVRHDLVVADSKALSRTLTQQLLRPLVGFNFGWDAPVPKFRFLHELPEDFTKTASVYVSLKNMGFPLSREHVSERFGVPLPQAGETLLTGGERDGQFPPRPASDPDAATSDTGRPVEAKSRPDHRQAAVDDLADRMASGPNPLEPMINRILEIGAKAETYEGFLADLYNSFPELHAESGLEDRLVQAGFTARIWGYLSAASRSGGSR